MDAQVAIPAAVFGALGAWLLTTAFDLVETTSGPTLRIIMVLGEHFKFRDPGQVKSVEPRYHALSAAVFVLIYTPLAILNGFWLVSAQTEPLWFWCVVGDGLLHWVCVFVWAFVALVV